MALGGTRGPWTIGIMAATVLSRLWELHGYSIRARKLQRIHRDLTSIILCATQEFGELIGFPSPATFSQQGENARGRHEADSTMRILDSREKASKKVIEI